MQNIVNVLDRFRCKSFDALQIITEPLHLGRGQGFQTDRAQSRDNVILCMLPIAGQGGRLDIGSVLRQPNFHPLLDRHFCRRAVDTLIQLHKQLLHLLADFLLRRAIDRTLLLLTGSRITPDCYPGLPTAIRALSDRTTARGVAR